MYRFFDMGLEAGVAAVILVPLFLVVNRIYFHDLGRTVGYLIFAIYLAGVDAVVGLPCITYIRLDFNYNFVPFLYMFSDCKNSLLNVLLFVPLGFFLPLFWKKFSAFGYTLLFGFCTSLLIELLQIFTFRATDVNDPGTEPSARTKDVFLVCGMTFGVMFFVQPFLAALVWNWIM